MKMYLVVSTIPIGAGLMVLLASLGFNIIDHDIGILGTLIGAFLGFTMFWFVPVLFQQKVWQLYYKVFAPGVWESRELVGLKKEDVESTILYPWSPSAKSMNSLVLSIVTFLFIAIFLSLLTVSVMLLVMRINDADLFMSSLLLA